MKNKMEDIGKFRVLSVGKMFALFGIFLGIIWILIALIVAALNPVLAIQTGLSPLGWTAAFFVLLYYLISYFIGGLLFAIFYNLFSDKLGRIQAESGKEVKKKK
jgi:hypothetical protein